MQFASNYRKDECYYIPNADVTICVSDVLFRVHRHILARDDSIFARMFAIDSGLQGNPDVGFLQEGQSDEAPIQLLGDTPDEFRALLWCLYALPQEIAYSMTPHGGRVNLLVNVLRMAHKYHFVTTEKWLIDTIRKVLPAQQFQPNFIESLVKVSEAAVLTSDMALLYTVRQLWRGIIGDGKHVAIALSTAERLGFRDLQGLAYQAMMLQGREAWERESLLTKEQRIRLLSGFHNISVFAKAVEDNPPDLDHEDQCMDPDQCAGDWRSVWKFLCIFNGSDHVASEAIPIPAKLDLINWSMMIVSVLKAMKDDPYIFEEEVELDSFCIEAAWKATLAFRDKLQTDMMDFFL